ncbi:MAG TPA: hypothetical protein VJV78_44560 [Polyangiales bacterium]|nr:hypothetical protein [Polyangiales bacterium]
MVFAAFLHLIGCGDVPSEQTCDGEPSTCSDEPAAIGCGDPAPAFAQVTAFEKCSNCHSTQLSAAARHGAPIGVDFDSESAAVNKSEEAAALVRSGAMPPPGSGVSLSESEKQALLRWSECL